MNNIFLNSNHTAETTPYQRGSALFLKAIDVVFKHEGYYSNDKDDPGGATKYGWSLRAAQNAGDLDLDGILDFDIDGDGDIDIEDIKALDMDDAKRLYKIHYWDLYGYEELPEIIAIKTFDLAVVMGARQAHKLLQRAVRSANHPQIADDGIIGSQTLKAVQSCEKSELIAALRSEAAGFFRLLVNIRPRSKKYLNGWLNRAYF